jgi:hypothetical protein
LMMEGQCCSFMTVIRPSLTVEKTDNPLNIHLPSAGLATFINRTGPHLAF